jgi:hypothetical protein
VPCLNIYLPNVGPQLPTLSVPRNAQACLQRDADVLYAKTQPILSSFGSPRSECCRLNRVFDEKRQHRNTAHACTALVSQICLFQESDTCTHRRIARLCQWVVLGPGNQWHNALVCIEPPHEQRFMIHPVTHSIFEPVVTFCPRVELSYPHMVLTATYSVPERILHRYRESVDNHQGTRDPNRKTSQFIITASHTGSRYLARPSIWKGRKAGY